MKKVIHWLDEHLEEYICILLLTSMTAIIFLQIVARSIGGDVSWNEELARYLFVWLIYVGCSFAVKKRRHISVEAVLLLFGRRGIFILNLVSNIFFFLFCLIVLSEAFPVLYKMHYKFKQLSPAMRLPLTYAYASVPVGFALMTFRLVQDSLSLIKKYRQGGK